MSDNERQKYIYSHLFSLAVVYHSEKRAGKNNPDISEEEKSINFLKTSVRLGYGEKSDYAKGIYYFIIGKKDNRYPKPEPLTTESLFTKLVSILTSLKEDLQTNPRSTPNNLKILDQSKIVELFSCLITLSPKEREMLGLTIGNQNVILQQSLLNLQRDITPEQRDEIIELYKTSIGLNQKNVTTSVIENLPTFIEERTKKYFDALGWSQWRNKDQKIQEHCRKISDHIRRIESQIGLGELTPLDPKIGLKSHNHHLTPDFIKRLIDSTIKNNLIRESIPLYFQYMTVEQLDPLPLYYPKPEDAQNEGLLNPDIIHPNNTNDNTGLASQYASQVTISFNFKISNKKLLSKLKSDLPKEVKRRLINEERGGLIFNVTSSGVGGQMSQMLKIINRALLWDVECLRNRYFPIAHDLVIHQDIIKNNIASPVWAHSLVRLCRIEYLQEALLSGKSYDQCAYINEVATGDYCGFNFLESVAKSAIQARLSAILEAKIDPEKYIQDLTKTIAQREIVRVATDFLNYYPFSLNAMESYLQSEMLDKGAEEEENPSYFYYDAYLEITMAYLREGLYRKAYKYLQKLRRLEEFECEIPKPEERQNKFPIFSGSELADYELCKAHYFYLCDEQDNDINYQWSGLPSYERSVFVTNSWKSIINAERHLKVRINKYIANNEISQSIFHPYFIILARINFLKAKLFLFFPCYAVTQIAQNDDLKDYHYGRLYFLELARIYSAKNGSTVDYACYSAYQSFVYIVTGYLVNKKIKTLDSNRSVNFTKTNCLTWAKRLRDNALIHYAQFGKECYYQIKEKSGVSKDSPNPIFGNFEIEKLPLIEEEQGGTNIGWRDEILHIDISLLHMKSLDDNNETQDQSIYLFGAKVAIILFARAMYDLCGDENTENKEQWKSKINKACRLFTYAWAVAEDGCETVSPQHQGDKYKIIRPSFKQRISTDTYPPIEAQSVIDLYPHRQSEIADLGKVFAIACHLHSLYLTESIEEKNSIKAKIDQLIDHFQDMSRTKAEDIEHQSRFNGHLRGYFDKVKGIIKNELELEKAFEETVDKPLNLKDVRERIMSKFFDFYNIAT